MHKRSVARHLPHYKRPSLTFWADYRMPRLGFGRIESADTLDGPLLFDACGLANALAQII
jgi:hypothetical protein